MTGIISVNLKKIKGATSVNRLLDENYREEKTAENYDNGRRIIDTQKTKDNIFLIERPLNYDKERKNRIFKLNEQRSQRKKEVPLDFDFWEADDKKKWQNQQLAQSRKLRSDVVDTLGIVIQPSAEFINSLSREEQIAFFKDAVDVLRAFPERFGKIDTAVIHFDENTPHAQILASTLNFDTLTSDAKKIVGNKSKMSDTQTIIAQGLRQKGWEVNRGIKRIDNPDYQNWADEQRQKGIEANRFTERAIVKANEIISQAKKKRLEYREDIHKILDKHGVARTFGEYLDDPIQNKKRETEADIQKSGHQRSTKLNLSVRVTLFERILAFKQYKAKQKEKVTEEKLAALERKIEGYKTIQEDLKKQFEKSLNDLASGKGLKDYVVHFTGETVPKIVSSVKEFAERAKEYIKEHQKAKELAHNLKEYLAGNKARDEIEMPKGYFINPTKQELVQSTYNRDFIGVEERKEIGKIEQAFKIRVTKERALKGLKTADSDFWKQGGDPYHYQKSPESEAIDKLYMTISSKRAKAEEFVKQWSNPMKTRQLTNSIKNQFQQPNIIQDFKGRGL